MNQTNEQISDGKVAPGAGGLARWTSATVALGGDGLTRELKTWEHELHITVGANGDDGVLTLPDVKAASGQFYLIKLLDDGDAKSISVVIPGVPLVLDCETDAFGTTIGSLTADSDYLFLYSTGHTWVVISELTT